MKNSRDLNELDPSFSPVATKILEQMDVLGYDMLVTSTRRDLQSQAAIYRVNRSRELILGKMERMVRAGWGFLAEVIEAVGPQPDQPSADGKLRPLTAAGPGESWHNFGMALDVAPLVSGKVVWADSHPAWAAYGRAAKMHGAEWAGEWTSFRELAHAQLKGLGGNPLSVLSKPEVMARLRGMF